MSSSSPAPDVQITLTPEFETDYEINGNVGFRLRVTASDGVGIDNEIFRYYQQPINPNTGSADSSFSGVCSWPDLVELPIVEPLPEESPAGFRLDYFDIVVDSETIANEVWDLIQVQVEELVQTVKDGENLEAQPPVVITSS